MSHPSEQYHPRRSRYHASFEVLNEPSKLRPATSDSFAQGSRQKGLAETGESASKTVESDAWGCSATGLEDWAFLPEDPAQKSTLIQLWIDGCIAAAASVGATLDVTDSESPTGTSPPQCVPEEQYQPDVGQYQPNLVEAVSDVCAGPGSSSSGGALPSGSALPQPGASASDAGLSSPITESSPPGAPPASPTEGKEETPAAVPPSTGSGHATSAGGRPSRGVRAGEGATRRRAPTSASLGRSVRRQARAVVYVERASASKTRHSAASTGAAKPRVRHRMDEHPREWPVALSEPPHATSTPAGGNWTLSLVFVLALAAALGFTLTRLGLTLLRAEHGTAEVLTQLWSLIGSKGLSRRRKANLRTRGGIRYRD
jgi:hypothetical protein